jgi:hypothetical protein
MKILNGLVLVLVLVLGACCGADDKEDRKPAVPEKTTNDGRHEVAVDGQRFGMTLTDLGREIPKDFQLRIRAGTTINVDAGTLEPSAFAALGGHAERAKAVGGGEGIVVCASEEGASYAFDGYPAIPIEGTKDARGWVCVAKRLAPGVHALKIDRKGSFPVETQIVVRPQVYDVIAVRFGRVGMTDLGGPR